MTTVAIENTFPIKNGLKFSPFCLSSSSASATLVGILAHAGELAVGLGHEGLQLFFKQLVCSFGSGGLNGRTLGTVVPVLPILPVVAVFTVFPEVPVFASLTLTYLVSAGISLILFFVFSEDKNLLAEMSKANWATFVLGIVLVLLEVGWIYMYRVGWKISVASVVANIGLACALLLVGVLFYKEVLTLRQLSGILLCMASMFLLAK